MPVTAYLTTGGVAHQDDTLLADASEISHQSRNVGNVIGEPRESKSGEGALQSELKDRVAETWLRIKSFSYRAWIRDGVRPVA